MTDIDALIAEASRANPPWDDDLVGDLIADLADALESLHKNLNNESEDWWKSKWEDSQAELSREQQAHESTITNLTEMTNHSIRLMDERDRAREVIEKALEAHKPFEWSFGYGPVTSCGLCAELGATEAQSAWPCETVRILATYDQNGADDD